jgi:hypothetical protein
MRLAPQQHQHEAGNLEYEAGINNTNTKLEIFSTRMASTTSTRSWKYLAQDWHQQHQNEDGNLQHKAGINNINMKMEIFNTRLASTTFCGTLTDPKDLPRNQKYSLGYEILTELPHGTLIDPKDLPMNHTIPWDIKY